MRAARLAICYAVLDCSRDIERTASATHRGNPGPWKPNLCMWSRSMRPGRRTRLLTDWHAVVAGDHLNAIGRKTNTC